MKNIPWVRFAFGTRHALPDLGAPPLVCKQIHSNICLRLDRPWDERPEADALATATAGLVLGVNTADCGPVLLASRKDRVVAAAHAGWKGALNGVLENTLAEMEKLGAKAADIVAVTGPCIGPQSYEVGAEFRETFLQHDRCNARFFRDGERAGYFLFDLPAFIAARLKGAGVGEVTQSGIDTLSCEADYFSHRRGTIRNAPETGRQVSAIVLL